MLRRLDPYPVPRLPVRCAANDQLKAGKAWNEDSEYSVIKMDGKKYKIVLAGKFAVGKTRIFEKLQSEVKDSMVKMQTVEVGIGTGTSSSLTGHSARGDRAKWTVRVTLPNGTDVTVNDTAHYGGSRPCN